MLPRTNCSSFGSQILWLFFIIVLLRHASIPLVEKVKLHIVVAGRRSCKATLHST